MSTQRYYCELERIRNKHGLTQRDLSEFLSVAQSTVSTWETGEYIPNGENLLKAMQLLNCTAHDLYPRDCPAPTITTETTYLGKTESYGQMSTEDECQEDNLPMTVSSEQSVIITASRLVTVICTEIEINGDTVTQLWTTDGHYLGDVPKGMEVT